MRYPISILFLCIFAPVCSFSQEKNVYKSDQASLDHLAYVKHYFKDTAGIQLARPNLIFWGIEGHSLKGLTFVFIELVNGLTTAGQGEGNKTNIVITPAVPFLRVHGNVMYEGFYQSNIDTPYIGRDIYQHTIHAALDMVVKDKYPLRINFTTRFSNSPLLKNITDFNLQFNSQGFKNTIKENLEKWNRQQLAMAPDLNKLVSLLAAKRNELGSLQGWLSSPSLLQRLVEEQEQAMVKSKFPSYKTPALQDSNTLENGVKVPEVVSLDKSVEEKRKRCDTLTQQIALLQKRYDSATSMAGNKKDSLINIIEHSKDAGAITSALHAMNLPDSVLPKGYKTLLALQSLSVGRSIVNYSELSVKNVSMQGIQAEYNPSYYLAFAAGTIDYRFRDFIINDKTAQKQYVSIIRYGIGKKDGNHIIASYFTGRKQLYNYNTDSLGRAVANPSQYNLMGFSLESRYQVTNSTYIVAEAAKSSLPFYNRQLDKQNLLASTLSFHDHSNEAYSFKLVSFLSKTRTRINAYYKHFGANFQSFSQFTTSSAQNAWYIKVEQPFFKKKLDVTASVRKNDFTNPYINQAFYNNSVFKSIQATLRLKKLPVLSVGYYPSSQLTKLGNDQYIENLFYTLVGTATYAYRYHSVMMNTILCYTQFYNKATDSNFVYFNTRNLLLGQSFFFPKFSLQFNASAAQNSAYNLYTTEGNIQYKLRSWLTLGGGLKYNRQTIIDNRQLGYSANTTLKIPKLGDIEFMAQKGFIPGINKQLVANNIGRLIYYKTF